MAVAATLDMMERDDALAGRGQPGSFTRSAAIAAALCLHVAIGALVMLAPNARGPQSTDGITTVELVLGPGAGDAVTSAPAPPWPSAPPTVATVPSPPIPPLAEALPVLPPLPVAPPPPLPSLASLLPAPPALAAPPAIPAESVAPPAPEPQALEPPPQAPPPESPRRVRAAEPSPTPRPAAPPRRPARDGAPGSAPAAPGGGDSQAVARSPVAEAPALAAGPPLITAPRFRRPPSPPAYPARAIELDLTGTVVVRALLDARGDPTETLVQRSSGHPILDSAAVAAVRRWAFEPASRDGQQIAAWVEVPVHFRLR